MFLNEHWKCKSDSKTGLVLTTGHLEPELKPVSSFGMGKSLRKAVTISELYRNKQFLKMSWSTSVLPCITLTQLFCAATSLSFPSFRPNPRHTWEFGNAQLSTVVRIKHHKLQLHSVGNTVSSRVCWEAARTWTPLAELERSVEQNTQMCHRSKLRAQNLYLNYP